MRLKKGLRFVRMRGTDLYFVCERLLFVCV